MAYTADVNQWRGPVEQPYRPHFFENPWHPGWIALTVLGFIFWWPVGLALLFYTIGSRKMGCWTHSDRFDNKMTRMQDKMERMRSRMERRGFPFGPRRAGRIPRLPRAPAPRQGQGRVRRLHGPAPHPSDPAERRAAELTADASLTQPPTARWAVLFCLSSRRTPGPITADGHNFAGPFRESLSPSASLPTVYMRPGFRRDDGRVVVPTLRNFRFTFQTATASRSRAARASWAFGLPPLK
jgi:hypothetical protein